jgi:DNA-binding LytR/AlgR family response regulator
VFVTAYDEYAIDAFERGAIDYLLKPVEIERLSRTVERIKARRAVHSGADDAGVSLAARVAALEQQVGRTPSRLRWLQASQGSALKLIDVDEVLYFRSDEKYTAVRTAAAEFLIRTPLRELISQLDAEHFWQVHRGSVVNVRAIDRVVRDDTGHLRIRMRGVEDVLDVSRSFQALFRQM